MKRSTARRAAALLTLTLGLALSAPAVTVAHDGHGHAANKAPKVTAKITLSPIGDKLVGAKIPIKGYLSGNSEKAKKVITLEQKINGTWKVKATKRQKANGAYKLRAQVVKKAGKVKYRTTVSYKGKVLDKSGTVRVKVIKNPNTENPTPVDTTAPAVPTGLVATAGDAKVTLRWSPVADNDLAHYIVYHSLPGATATETNTTSTSITITGLKNGTEYYFALRAKDKSGNLSNKSGVATATPKPDVNPDTTPPAVPTGLKAVAGNATVTLTWAPVTAADLAGYTVFRSLPGQAAVETNVTTNTLTVNGLENGKEYFFSVLAYDKTGNKSAKSAAIGIVPIPPKPAPVVEKRTIDGAKYCQVLQVQIFNQSRTNTWQWDGDSYEPLWSEWTTDTEALREAAAVDCLNIVASAPTDALLPDLRMRNLDVCSPTEKERNGGDCFGIYTTTVAFPGIPVGTKLLKFPILTLNVGAGPSEVIADRSGDPNNWTAYQTFYDAQGNRESVATDAEFYFAGDGHDHWHIQDFDYYTITDATGALVGEAEKHGYCLEDNTSAPGTPGDAEPVYKNARVCGKGLPNALTIVHGLSKGWGDTYPTTLPDQGVNINDLLPGRYTITVFADEQGVLVESDEGNNWASVEVDITADGQANVVPLSASGGIP